MCPKESRLLIMVALTFNNNINFSFLFQENVTAVHIILPVHCCMDCISLIIKSIIFYQFGGFRAKYVYIMKTIAKFITVLAKLLYAVRGFGGLLPKTLWWKNIGLGHFLGYMATADP